MSTHKVSPAILPTSHRGICAITALGDYDPKHDGHLVQWDLKLIIKFPPRSTILIPSVSVHHCNISIHEGETQYSFTQYVAGRLFHRVDHGFQTEKVYKSGWSKQRKQEGLAIGRHHWEEAIDLFPTLEELHSLNSATLIEGYRNNRGNVAWTLRL